MRLSQAYQVVRENARQDDNPTALPMDFEVGKAQAHVH